MSWFHSPGGVIDTVADTHVLIDNVAPVKRLDSSKCWAGATNFVAFGAFSVMYGHKAAARAGDAMLHAGLITGGYPNVLIGDTAWSHAGERFATEAEAARAACDEANAKGIPTNTEWAGTIYKNPPPDNGYSYTPPVQGSRDRSDADASPAPDGTTPVGDYHCHGDYSNPDGTRTCDQVEDNKHGAYGGDHADMPSKDDQRGAGGRADNTAKYPGGYTGYVGTPDGGAKRYGKSSAEPM